MSTVNKVIQALEDADETIKNYLAKKGSSGTTAVIAELKNKQVFEKVDSLLTRLGDLSGYDEEPGNSDIGGFMESVSKSVVQAQRQLDVETEQYMASKPVVDRMFGIPKASAEFEFEISSYVRRKKGFIISSKVKKSEESTSQRVSFDIVAAPLPPTDDNQALMQQGTVSALARRVASSGAMFETLKNAFAEAAAHSSLDDAPGDSQTVKDNKAQKRKRLGAFSTAAAGGQLLAMARMTSPDAAEAGSPPGTVDDYLIVRFFSKQYGAQDDPITSTNFDAATYDPNAMPMETVKLLSPDTNPADAKSALSPLRVREMVEVLGNIVGETA